MCWSRALLLLMVQLRSVEAVPISMDKTKVKEPEKKPDEPPASVVSLYTIVYNEGITKQTSCSVALKQFRNGLN